MTVIVVIVGAVFVRFVMRPPFPNIIKTTVVSVDSASWSSEDSLVATAIDAVALQFQNARDLWQAVPDTRALPPEKSVYRPSNHRAVVKLRRKDDIVVICRIIRRDEAVEITMMYPK